MKNSYKQTNNPSLSEFLTFRSPRKKASCGRATARWPWRRPSWRCRPGISRAASYRSLHRPASTRSGSAASGVWSRPEPLTGWSSSTPSRRSPSSPNVHWMHKVGLVSTWKDSTILINWFQEFFVPNFYLFWKLLTQVPLTETLKDLINVVWLLFYWLRILCKL